MTTSSDSPTPSDCASDSTNASLLAEPVKRCIRALEAAETDTEKLAALFVVPKLVRSPDCVDRASKLRLMKGIGYSFIARMLRSKDAPEGCPKLAYQSLALSVLSCFADEPEIMTNASILFNLPVLLDAVNNADDEVYEDNLLIISDAYACLSSIVSSDEGRKAFIGYRGVHYLCRICVRQTFRHEEALRLLLNVLTGRENDDPWSYHEGDKDYDAVMLKFCEEFRKAEDERKFELCEIILTVLRSRTDNTERPWMPYLKSGLKDVLFSKIGKPQRDPAIKLAAAVVEASDFDWCLSEESDCKFFMILLNLVCIEIIMHLDEKKLETAIQDSDVLIACFFIVENAVGYLVGDKSVISDPNKKTQLYAALKNAFVTVVKFVRDFVDEGRTLEDPKEKFFVLAVVRLLGAWLAEETSAARSEVYAILPFLFSLAAETFVSRKASKLDSLPGVREDRPKNDEEDLRDKAESEMPTDVLRFLLPGLCHLAVEDESRKIFIDRKMHETLYSYACYHWSIFSSYKRWIDDQSVSEDKVDVARAEREMTDSKYALTTICNVFMNICVLEPEFVDKSPVFFRLRKLTENAAAPEIAEAAVLRGNFCVLGLLVLKHTSSRRQPNETDLGFFKFLQTSIRFFWDAFNVEESANQDELEVSSDYAGDWDDLEDLWYFGMQILSSILEDVTWIAEFILECGWAGEIVGSLVKARRGGMRDAVKSAYEDLLCQLLKIEDTRTEALDELKRNDVIALCQKHHLGSLAKLISSPAAKRN